MLTISPHVNGLSSHLAAQRADAAGDDELLSWYRVSLLLAFPWSWYLEQTGKFKNFGVYAKIALTGWLTRLYGVNNQGAYEIISKPTLHPY